MDEDQKPSRSSTTNQTTERGKELESTIIRTTSIQRTCPVSASGIQLDSQWSIRGHKAKKRTELRIKMAILRKVAGTDWGLGNKILTTAASALIESVIILWIRGRRISKLGKGN